MGFFEAGNFYPDFILWLVEGENQRIKFVDPKGIRNLGPNDPKMQFYQTIKEIEQRLGDGTVRLESWIVSVTPFYLIGGFWGMDKPQLRERHVVFQEEDKDTYIRTILETDS